LASGPTQLRWVRFDPGAKSSQIVPREARLQAD
jgi:hypothetical protein